MNKPVSGLSDHEPLKTPEVKSLARLLEHEVSSVHLRLDHISVQLNLVLKELGREMPNYRVVSREDDGTLTLMLSPDADSSQLG